MLFFFAKLANESVLMKETFKIGEILTRYFRQTGSFIPATWFGTFGAGFRSQ